MFIKYFKNPIIERKPKSFHSIHVANPDIIKFQDKIFIYFRGQGSELHDQIGVGYVEPECFDGVNWKFNENNPVIKVSENNSSFDCNHILDPAAMVFKEKIYLYYSGHSHDKAPGIGLAVSENGFDFIKIDQIIENAIAPEVVFKDGLIHLFYQRKTGDYFEFYKCTSEDGFSFKKEDEIVVLGPSHIKGNFDSFSVTTCRIFKDGDIFYMTYSGCQRFDDYPESFCLAKSTDLENWYRYPHNPILHRGKSGDWDEGAIWFPTVYNHKNKYYLWYEGSGAGLGIVSVEAKKASEICRNNDYGGYAKTNFSQIGLAVYEGETLNW